MTVGSNPHVLSLPPTDHKHAVQVNWPSECECEWLSVIGWLPVQVNPASRPMADRLQLAEDQQIQSNNLTNNNPKAFKFNFIMKKEIKS